MATKKKTAKKKKCSIAFQPVSIDSLFPVLDAIAWLDLPNLKEISQFAGLDPRTTGKVIKNAQTIGIVQHCS